MGQIKDIDSKIDELVYPEKPGGVTRKQHCQKQSNSRNPREKQRIFLPLSARIS